MGWSLEMAHSMTYEAPLQRVSAEVESSRKQDTAFSHSASVSMGVSAADKGGGTKGIKGVQTGFFSCFS